MLYVFYITTTPYLPCNNKNINQKELYDFYYTAITLTTGYIATYLTPIDKQSSYSTSPKLAKTLSTPITDY